MSTRKTTKSGKRTYAPRRSKHAADIIQRYKKIVPAFKKYGKKKTFTIGELRFINRVEKLLSRVDNLIPVSKQQSKKFKDQLFTPHDIYTGEIYGNAPRVQAIQFRNTGAHVRVRTVRNDLLMTSNGRDYIYWKLDRVTPRAIGKAGEAAFHEFENTFPIERITELAERAFEIDKVKYIYLWGSRGRCNEAFDDFDAFMEWVVEEYSHYKDVNEWVNGIVLAV